MKNWEPNCIIRIDNDMIHGKLMPHQDKIVEFLATKQYGGCFADFGSGKTLCFLSLINKMRWKKVLVVSTKLSIQSTWPSEIRKWTDFSWVPLLGWRRKKLRLLEHGMNESYHAAGRYHGAGVKPIIFLLNYDGLRNIYPELAQCQFDAIVLDESTKIKSPHTRRTKILWDMGKRVSRRYIATGFPVTEDLADLYAQIKFLDQSNLLGPSYYAFLNTYFVKVGMRILPKKAMREQLLEKIKPFCIRITNDVLRLPPKVYRKVDIPLTDKQAGLLTQFRESFRLELGKVKFDTQYIFALLAKSLQICDGFVQDDKGNVETILTNKDESLVDLLSEMDAKHSKVVIWAAFKFSLNKIARYLTRLGYGVLVLTGETDNPDLMVKRFQNDKRYTILLATQRKAAESVTLTAARYMIFYSNLWSYDSRSNAEARIRRKGSEGHSSIVYVDLVTQKSVESQVYKALHEKADMVTELKKEFLTVGGA